MNSIDKNLQQNITFIKKRLISDDVLIYEFETASEIKCCVIYIDGITDKVTLGERVAKPLSKYEGQADFNEILLNLCSPENEETTDFDTIIEKLLNGSSVLFIDGLDKAILIAIKQIPARAITEPPSEVTVKGPREGFIEDIKTNCALVRRRLKTPDLVFENIVLGKQSQSLIAVCYVNNIADKTVIEKIKRKLQTIDIDNIASTSYVAKFLSHKPYSIFRQVHSTEKPDTFVSKLLEGRVGIIVDGSPITITLPYLLVEEFQSAEDYYLPPLRASLTRFLRFFAVIVAILLPAFYVSAQLFKIQLIPLDLLLNIAGSTQGISLSPSLEMFLALILIKILNEASVRMPKPVGLALSIVGALVLGDTAVKAGVLSSPTVIIIALSAISLFTVPSLTETSSILRYLFLLIAGSIGTYGIILLICFLLIYLVSADSYGVPLLAPFSPMIGNDMKDALLKASVYDLDKRPKVFNPSNKTRLKTNRDRVDN